MNVSVGDLYELVKAPTGDGFALVGLVFRVVSIHDVNFLGIVETDNSGHPISSVGEEFGVPFSYITDGTIVKLD